MVCILPTLATHQRVKHGRVTDSACRGQKESDKAAVTHIKSSHVGGGGKKARVPRRKERWRWGRDSDIVWQDWASKCNCGVVNGGVK